MRNREKQYRVVLFGLLSVLGLIVFSASATTTWYAAASGDASDDHAGTFQQPVRSVEKAVSLAKPGMPTLTTIPWRSTSVTR